MMTPTKHGPTTVVERIQCAVNQHDLENLASCFAPDYQSEQPIHPDRAFQGREQMRKNWSQIFAGVPDIKAEVLRCAVDGDTVWTEWELRGTRRDGAPHRTAMVTIGGVKEGHFVWMRLYMEQVDESRGIDAAVQQSVGGREAP